MQGERERLDHEIVERELVGGLVVLVLGRGAVDLFARGEKFCNVAVDRQIEMRDGLRRFEQAAGDDLSHRVVRHRLKTAGHE